ncbi:MAG: long-chain fatty acid--CoA ligase [Pseudomonadota bacterium]
MLVDDFLEHLKNGGDKPAIISDEGAVSYDQFHNKISKYCRELAAQSISGSCVLLVDNYSITSISMLFALWKHNNVVALSVPKNEDHIAQLANTAGAKYTIIGGVPHEFTILKNVASKVPPVIDELLYRSQAGFIVFSSGSTGKAKGVVHKILPFFHRYLSANNCGAILAFLLFDHIGGLVTVLHALATHGSLVIPNARSPQEVGRCIEAFNVETLHVSPTLLNLAILTGVFLKWDTRSIRRIYYGSEPSSAVAIQRIRNALPHVELCQLYGMSEIGVLPCRNKDGDSAWMKVEDQNYSIKVVDGILHVRGATNMVGYISGSASLSSDGFLITEDLAEEKEGFFRVTGRAIDVINVGGKKVIPSDVEQVLMKLENVSDVVVYAHPNHILGHVVAARFTLLVPQGLEDFKIWLYKNIRSALSPEQLPRVVSISETPLHTTRFKKMRNPDISIIS